MKHIVVIVEDEKEIAYMLNAYFEANGLTTVIFYDGYEVVDWIKNNAASVLLLDLMLPGKDGLQICREIRSFSTIPIIMTTAKTSENDRIKGLDIGADDYVCKPYSAKELVARVKAVIRRLDGKVAEKQSALALNKDSMQITNGSKTVKLTVVEFNLFNLLYSNPGRIYSREQILDLVYSDFRDISDRTVDSHIRNLRKKLLIFNFENELIKAVYGAGYVYEA